MERGFKIGQLFDIDLRIDWSWLIIFGLITWSWTAQFSQIHDNWSTTLVLGTGITASLLFFLSILVHEMAHSLVAQTRGVSVRSITLFLFGGISNIQRNPPSPKAEFLITIVGPLTSFILGVLMLLAAGFTVDPSAAQNTQETFSQLDPLTTLLVSIGSINIVLAVFNMIPGFPLDGGRILRSVLWKITGSLRKSTRWAALVGQAVGWGLIAIGILMVFGVRVPFFGTGGSGLWLAIMGFFLNGSAVQGYQRVIIEDVLEDVDVQRVMLSDPPTVSPTLALNQLVDDHVMKEDDTSFPVVDDAGQLVGLVTMSDIRSVDRVEWSEHRVRDIMTPADDLETVTVDTPAHEALRTLSGRDVRQLPVVTESGELAGLLRRRDITKWLQLHSDAISADDNLQLDRQS
jgi:Zn-dependent protease/CBS domain-containing protein